jgi:coenzyme F420-reducing hydrogenase delta subunit
MSEALHSGISIYVCRQCIPASGHLPRQWNQDGMHVTVQELPCSGKTDAEYLFHALESGARGVLVVTCPRGECQLSQGNYRAEVRIGMVQRLLAEIGLEPKRAVLLHCGPGDDLRAMVSEAVTGFRALGTSPLCAKQ